MRFVPKLLLLVSTLGAVLAPAAMAAMAATAAEPAKEPVTVITGGHLLDVTTGQWLDHPAVFVENGRVTSIADARTVKWGKGVRHIDLGNRYLLPGLIDMHVHLTSLAEVGGYQDLRYTDTFWTAVGVANAAKTLNIGFTTVRNVGSADFADGQPKQGTRLHRSGRLVHRRHGRPLRRQPPAAVDGPAQPIPGEWSGRGARARSLAAQVWRPCHQDLRYGWRVLARRFCGRPAADVRGDEGHCR